MYRRWTGRYRFGWKPRLSFDRRKMELLDWIEGNLEHAAFAVREGTVGIALGPELRIYLNRTSLTLTTGPDAAPTMEFKPWMDQVVEVLAPLDVHILDGLIGTSYGMGDRNYEEECRNVAAVTSFGSSHGWTTTDASVVVDAEHDSGRVQVEWGVVKPSELLERLTSRVGRIHYTNAEDVPVRVDEATLPGASLFAECFFMPVRSTIGTADEILGSVLDLEQMSENITTALFTTYASHDRKSA